MTSPLNSKEDQWLGVDYCGRASKCQFKEIDYQHTEQERLTIAITMSVDTASMPPWKLALLERKRRQEEEELVRMKEETSRAAEIPTWKRDLLFKKKYHDNSTVFIADGEQNSSTRHNDIDQVNSQSRKSRPDSGSNYVDGDFPADIPNHSGGVGGGVPGPLGDEKAVVDEPIIPIVENPWFKSDYIKKRSPRSDENKNRIVENDRSVNERKGSNRHSYGEPDDVFTDNVDHMVIEDFSDKDSDSEEVYQPGFVSKLLNKFRHLTSPREEAKSVSGIPKSPVEGPVPQRSHSYENLLDEKTTYHPLSPRDHELPNRKTQTMGKATSMENIHSKQKSTTRTSLPSPILASPSTALTREDIIIIEAPHPEKEPLPNVDNTSKKNEKSGKDFRNSVRDSAPTELPRPNFVSSTRSLFESVDTLRLKKRKSPAPPKQEATTAPTSKPTQPVQPIRQSSIESSLTEENTVKTINNDKKVTSTVPSNDKPLNHNNNVSSSNLTNGVGVISNLKPARNTTRKTDSAVHNIKRAGKSWSYGPSDSDDPVKINTESVSEDTEVILVKTSVTNNKDSVQNHTNNQSLSKKSEVADKVANGNSGHINKENNNLAKISRTSEKSPVTNTSSVKKRQAPKPPAVNVSTDELQKKASNISKSWSTRTTENDLDQKEKTTLKEKNKTPVIKNEKQKPPSKSVTPSSKVKSTSEAPINRPIPRKSQPAPIKKPRKNTGPGKFSIRPASNLVVAPNRYNSYTVTKPDSDIPVTNIDDIPDDVPFTNIDDVDDEPLSPTTTGSKAACPPEVTKLDLSFTNDSSETDNDSPKQVHIPPCRIVFEGAGVIAKKSLIKKSSNKRVSIHNYVYIVGKVGWLCLTSHRQRGHLEMAPLSTVPCEGREARFLHRPNRESNPGLLRGSLLHNCCVTPAPKKKGDIN